MESQIKQKDISSLHDIKETAKRTIQFTTIALLVATLIIPVRLYFGHYIGAAQLSIFCIFCVLVMWLNKTKKSHLTKAVTIIGVDVFLVMFNITDGLNMGGYLYFFPMFFALPFMINNHERYTKEVAF